MWGAWAIGMAAVDMMNMRRLERLGMGSIAPVAGLNFFAGLMMSSLRASQVVSILCMCPLIKIHLLTFYVYLRIESCGSKLTPDVLHLHKLEPTPIDSFECFADSIMLLLC